MPLTVIMEMITICLVSILNSFENTYDNQLLPQLNNRRLIFYPFLVELPDNVEKVCITESDLWDYPGMFLQSNPDSFSMKGVWAPLPEKTEQGGHNQLQQIVMKRYDYIARTNGKAYVSLENIYDNRAG